MLHPFLSTPWAFARSQARRAAATVLIALSSAAGAQSVITPDGGLGQELVQDTQRWIESAVSAAELPSGGVPLRMEVVVGALDSRLRLAPCQRMEPYLPAGTRLWGRSRVGLRCLEGPVRWNVFLPVTVKAYGRAWVMRSNMNAGAVISKADVMESEVDWAEESSPVLLDPNLWAGSVAARALSAGQTVRQSVVRAPTAFTAGAQVRVVAQGNGFSVSTEAQAMGSGVVGQTVRLRMDSGRIVSGLVMDARTVKLDM